MKNKSFNLYYLNFSKVYEIAMMLNNIIPEKVVRENLTKSEFYKKKSSSIELDSEKYLARVKAISEIENGKTITLSNKMVETLNVKTTKSILLRQIESKCKEYKKENALKEGDLVKIDNVELSIYDEDNQREIQLLRKDALKGFSVGGLDMNNLISSVLNDYCYVLKGTIDDDDNNQIILKIPMEADNEFESKYSIYDLLIGKVSIIGVYKQEVNESKISDSTFRYFTNSENNRYKKKEKVISSTDDITTKNEKKENERKYKYIDVIGIIQNIEFKEQNELIKMKWYQRLIRKIFRIKEQEFNK